MALKLRLFLSVFIWCGILITEQATPMRIGLLFFLAVLMIALITFYHQASRLKKRLLILGIQIAVLIVLLFFSQWVFSFWLVLLFVLLAEQCLSKEESPFHMISVLLLFTPLFYFMVMQLMKGNLYRERFWLFHLPFFFLSVLLVVCLSQLRRVKYAHKLLQEKISLEKEEKDILLKNVELLSQLSEERERNIRSQECARVARELHDDVGHALTGHIMEIEMLKIQYKKNPEKIEMGLERAASHSREVLKKLREIVSSEKNKPLTSSLKVLLQDQITLYENQHGIKVYFEFDPDLIWIEKDAIVAEMVNKIILEGLTNVSKHSDSSEVWVSFQSLGKSDFLLKIINHGQVEKDFKWGNGLQSIEKRAEEISAKMEVYCDESGFSLMIKRFEGGAND